MASKTQMEKDAERQNLLSKCDVSQFTPSEVLMYVNILEMIELHERLSGFTRTLWAMREDLVKKKSTPPENGTITY